MRCGQNEAVEVLLANGAAVNQTDQKGCNAYEPAIGFAEQEDNEEIRNLPSLYGALPSSSTDAPRKR